MTSQASRREVEPSFPSAPINDRATRLALALILTVVFLAYLDTLWFQFVCDDRTLILGNTWLRTWKYLPRYFTSDCWAFEHPAYPGTYYRPIFLLWLRLQYLVFGLNPWGWHLCTVLSHLGVTWLVYFIAARLLGDRLTALFATLIFGLHPAHAQTVAYVADGNEPQCAVLLFASYLCYLKRRADPTHARIYLVSSLGLYGMASLSKENAVILPFIILACELVWSERTTPSPWGVWVQRSFDALKVAAPYLALLAIYVPARILSLGVFQSTRSDHSYLSMFLTWPSVLWFYLRHLLWPTNLTPLYPYEFCSRLDIRNVVLPAVPVLMSGVGLWIWSKRSPRTAVATVWMVVPILPVLDLRAFFEGQLVQDRWLYVPSFGFAMLAALGLRHLSLGHARLLGQSAVQLGVAAIIGLAMAMGITQATACYANEATFSTYATAIHPRGPDSAMVLAGLLGNEGHVDEAIKIYKNLWATQPDSWDVNYNLGYAYYLTGNLSDADRFLSRSVQIDDSRPNAFFYLGLTKLKMGDVNAAAANIQRALAIRPDAEHYHFALGVIFRLQGNSTAALAEFQKELDLDPDNASARQQAQEIIAAQTKQRH